jgi:cysteine sulfinate desulfinase/cysteine desulfurase-like protein
MKVPDAIGRGSIRFSLGRYNTSDDVETTLSALDKIVGKCASTQLAV